MPKTFIVILNHCCAGREFGQTLLVEADSDSAALEKVGTHLHEAGSKPVNERGEFWMECDYFVHLISIKEANTFKELKSAMVTLS